MRRSERLNLRRDFESRLLHRVQSTLGELSLPDPIIVAGQTATGKTIGRSSGSFC
jgi:hypothetical protein